jgi:hypothetical protein
MKSKIVILVLMLPLLATKCVEKHARLYINNETGTDLALIHHKGKSIAELAQLELFPSDYDIVKKGKYAVFEYPRSTLGQFASIKPGYYTFYFLKTKTGSSNTTTFAFEKPYDSINVKIANIKLEDKAAISGFHVRPGNVTYSNQ